MGLDITAYRKLVPAPDAPLDESGYPTESRHWRPGGGAKWSEEAFPGRGQGIDPDVVYAFGGSFGFRAGSYGSYGIWRRSLGRMMGCSIGEPCDVYRSGPFSELINFADNEGVIGPVVSAKLARDFAEHEARAAAFAGRIEKEMDWFKKYQDWKAAFDMAADGGAVEFH